MDGAVTVPDLPPKDTASVTDTPPRDVNFNGLVQMPDQPPKQVGIDSDCSGGASGDIC